jgi:ketosteroid isomerase-like protein
VALVRSIYADWERGDFRSVEWAHPEIEFFIADGPSPGSWTGLAGMAEGYSGVLSGWNEVRVKADEYRALDDERVLVLDHRTGRGRASGLELGQMRSTAATLFQARDGKVIKLVLYWDRDRAFADLGLAPEDDTANSPGRGG